MSLESYLVAALAVVLAGISKSGFAGGLGMLGVPLVSLTMSPQLAATLLLPIWLGIDVVSVWRFRRDWDFSVIGVLMPGAAAGIALGMATFSRIDADWLRLGIGCLALVFALQYFFGFKFSTTGAKHRARVFLVSALSGFAGFIAHAGGPPIKGTFLNMGLSKSAFVGTNAVFFLTLNLAKSAGYAGLGLFSAESLVSSASLIPFLVLGVLTGFALHNRVSQALFSRLAFVLLTFAAVNLIWVGGAALIF